MIPEEKFLLGRKRVRAQAEMIYTAAYVRHLIWPSCGAGLTSSWPSFTSLSCLQKTAASHKRRPPQFYDFKN